ncbi:MAG: hypothetical protein P8Y80_06885 [Acidobacteriota bacterium]|jgi:hypothetical protein
MRYHEFRDQMQIALGDAGLSGQYVGDPTETVDLNDMGRRCKIYISGSTTADTEPFYVAAKIAFNWNPFETARSYTREEDLLTEILGRTKRPSKTKPRHVRVDLVLSATLPHGSTTAVPEPRTFGSWANSLRDKLDKVFTEGKWRRGQLVSVKGFLEQIQVDSKLDSAGRLSVEGLSIAGFRMVRVPRVWDDPDRRESEKGAEAEISRFVQNFKYSLDQWSSAISELARWVRYAQPTDDKRQTDRSVRKQRQKNEGKEPDTIH